MIPKKLDNLFIFFILLVYLLAIFFPVVSSIKLYENDTVITNYSNTTIKIVNITYGHNLKVKVINNGDADAININFNVDITGGLWINIPEPDFKISLLSPNEIYEKTIKLFGIGLGIVTDIPQITLTADGTNTDVTNRVINVKIFGPFVKKINEISNYEGAFDGYTLFAPMRSHTTYLINNSGEIIHTWQSSYPPGDAVYLLEDGNLLHTALPMINPRFMAGGIGGYVELFDINSNLLWEFHYTNDQHCLHHDVEMLPNGNILMIAWEYKSYDECIAAGRNPNLLYSGQMWPDHIIEVEPTGNIGGNIVWEWHVWDHLIQDFDPSKDNYGVIADHPELIDINFVGNLIFNGDWNHINSVDYNEEFDQILLSVNKFSEIWVIDHSTNITEAASHSGGNSGKGGDILYRWGNPRAYGAGEVDDQKLFECHDAQWIEDGCPGEGNILIFNNGQGRPGGDYSSVEEIIPPVDENGNYSCHPGLPYEPIDSIWEYYAPVPSNLNAIIMSGTQRLPNGNTIICDGPKGFFYEVSYDKEIVWDYMVTFPNPYLNNVFKVRKYSSNYSGLENILLNLPPEKPSKPNGINIGKVGIEYYFHSKAIDPNSDDLFYIFDWGDGTFSNWLGPFESGEEVNSSHIWEETGRFNIRVMSKDIFGRESDWSDSFIFKMPILLNRYSFFNFFK